MPAIPLQSNHEMPLKISPKYPFSLFISSRASSLVMELIISCQNFECSFDFFPCPLPIKSSFPTLARMNSYTINLTLRKTTDGPLSFTGWSLSSLACLRDFLAQMSWILLHFQPHVLSLPQSLHGNTTRLLVASPTLCGFLPPPPTLPG